MKKLLAFALMLFVPVSMFAFDDDDGNESKSVKKRNNIYVAFETGTYKYREPHMEYPIQDKGHKNGISVEYIGRGIMDLGGFSDKPDNSFATLEARYMTGKVDYTGYLMDGTPHSAKGEKDYYFEGRLTFGKTYALMDAWELWPYLGFGWRRLVNNGENVDPSAYKRISNYYYVPLGVRFVKDVDGGFTIAFIGEFDWLLLGKQSSRLFDDGSYLNNRQKKGLGARFSVKVDVPVSPKIGVFVEPYFRMWKIQNSEVQWVWAWNGSGYEQVGLLEPYNTTRELGIKAGFYF